MYPYIKYCLLLIFVTLFLCPPASAGSVKVGGYVFPPFVEEAEEGFRGLALDMITVMNGFQGKYRFVFVPTTSKRRYRDFDEKEYDLIFFENINWGWQKRTDIQASLVFLRGGEVYISRAGAMKDERYFDDLKTKSIAAHLGYHYGFADFRVDESWLRKNFTIELSSTHEGNILKVLRGRTDVAVITRSYLDRYIKSRPEIKDRLLISSRPDQIYEHTILLRKNSAPSVTEINRLLREMEKAGVLGTLWQKYGISDKSFASESPHDEN